MTQQRQSRGGTELDPKHLPDAPVPWERSDARSMRPAEEGGQQVIEEGDPAQPAEGGEVVDDEGHAPEQQLIAPDSGPAPG